MLLRFFVNCYGLDIMDEHAFLQWKEDVNDSYPGKGVALFQVCYVTPHVFKHGFHPLMIDTQTRPYI